jgi:hypothetical protein
MNGTMLCKSWGLLFEHLCLRTIWVTEPLAWPIGSQTFFCYLPRCYLHQQFDISLSLKIISVTIFFVLLRVSHYYSNIQVIVTLVDSLVESWV